MQFRESSISSAPSKATSIRVEAGRESNLRSLRLAFSITCYANESDLGYPNEYVLIIDGDACLPRLVSCGYEVYIRYSGVVEGLDSFDNIDYRAPGAYPYITG